MELTDHEARWLWSSLAMELAGYGARWSRGSLATGLTGYGARCLWGSLAMGLWGSLAMGLAGYGDMGLAGYEARWPWSSLAMELADHADHEARWLWNSLAMELAGHGARWLRGSLAMELAGHGVRWSRGSLAMGLWVSLAMGLAGYGARWLWTNCMQTVSRKTTHAPSPDQRLRRPIKSLSEWFSAENHRMLTLDCIYRTEMRGSRVMKVVHPLWKCLESVSHWTIISEWGCGESRGLSESDKIRGYGVMSERPLHLHFLIKRENVWGSVSCGKRKITTPCLWVDRWQWIALRYFWGP